MTIHVNGNLTRLMNPGDIIHLGGIFLPITVHWISGYSCWAPYRHLSRSASCTPIEETIQRNGDYTGDSAST